MPFSHIYEHQYQAFFKRLAYYSIPYILYFTQYQAHPPQLGLLVVSGLRRLQLVHKPATYKIVQQYADENGCQGDEKALYHILIIFVQILIQCVYPLLMRDYSGVKTTQVLVNSNRRETSIPKRKIPRIRVRENAISTHIT